MIRITNFKQSEKCDKVEFDVTKEGKTNHVEIDATNYGATMTDIEEFTEDWSDRDFDSLDSFISNSTSLVSLYVHEYEITG